MERVLRSFVATLVAWLAGLVVYLFLSATTGLAFVLVAVWSVPIVGIGWLAVFLPVVFCADSPVPATRRLVLSGALTGLLLAALAMSFLGGRDSWLDFNALSLTVLLFGSGVGALAGWLYPRLRARPERPTEEP